MTARIYIQYTDTRRIPIRSYWSSWPSLPGCKQSHRIERIISQANARYPGMVLLVGTQGIMAWVKSLGTLPHRWGWSLHSGGPGSNSNAARATSNRRVQYSSVMVLFGFCPCKPWLPRLDASHSMKLLTIGKCERQVGKAEFQIKRLYLCGRLVSFDKWSDSKLAFAGVVIPVRRYLPVWRELSTLLLGPSTCHLAILITKYCPSFGFRSLDKDRFDLLIQPSNRFGLASARSVPVTKNHPLPLPTPPNSISPGLPAHGLRAQLQKARLDPIDSDLDLHHDAAGSAPGETQGGTSILPDSYGAITPGMLAKYHLPEIMLNHGPLAIRYVMGYLTTSVPGFSGIPPAKARRLVVAALEGKGCGGEGGGINGDVVFEKVGWGRWDARRRGQPARRELSPPTEGMGIPISSVRWDGRPHHSSSDASACAFSHEDYDHDMAMMENEADKMSLDGSASASCSEAPDYIDTDMMHHDDPEDATDDEDWAAVGAAGLRAASYSNTGFGVSPGVNKVYNGSGMARTPQLPRGFNTNNTTVGFASASDAQEREAVEALLQLGSV
ncbi:hypothetical protein OOU_Y34scaffold00087g43 [Pyricularia oryzae Y34]|uniref:Uncharacterized protein n=2 Tax=Pyricularia oryzae TaxID=318829 RepID=A0AA97P9A7_PYRO3|nr:hypothetical protein OOU_Y34scaffold00087g43 [Pyricularia oryzae Y34]